MADEIEINNPDFRKLDENREDIESRENQLKEKFRNYNKISSKTLNQQFDV